MFLAEDMAAHSFGRGSIISDINSHKLERLTERPKPSSPEFNTSEMMELFISEENIGQMENILDTWSSNLKVIHHLSSFSGSRLLSDY